jgi:hypothetical protein
MKQQQGGQREVRDKNNVSNFVLQESATQEEGYSFYAQLISIVMGIVGILYKVCQISIRIFVVQ